MLIPLAFCKVVTGTYFRAIRPSRRVKIAGEANGYCLLGGLFLPGTDYGV